MKILIVMGGFFPGNKYGGPPVSVDNFCSLMKEHECFIVTHDHDLFETKRFESIQEGWNDRGNSKVLYVPDTEYNKGTFERVIRELDPDILYLQGLFQSCVLPCLQLAKKYSIPVLLAPRGELCAGAFNIKKWKKLPYVKMVRVLGLVKNTHWQSTSDEETEAIKKVMKASDDHIHRLANIPSIPKRKYPRREKKAGEGHFVFLSRIHPKKNLLFAISLFKDVAGKAYFDIYGPIEDENYWKQCQDEINSLSDNVIVKYKGLVEHDQVHEVFSQYDAFLFPTLSENYGHVIVESLVVGTPVIISDQTPWNDVENSGAGWVCKLSDNRRYSESLNALVNMTDTELRQMSIDCLQYANKVMRIGEMKQLYRSGLESIYDNEKGRFY